MPTPRPLKPRTPLNRRSISSAGRLAVGSSSTRKSQLTTSARAIATSNFSVRLKLRTLRLGSISPINASASSGVSATGSPDRQKENRAMPLPADRDGGGPRFAPSGSDLTFECALDCVLPTTRIRVATPRSGLSNDG
jgi:hypothetical protein